MIVFSFRMNEGNRRVPHQCTSIHPVMKLVKSNRPAERPKIKNGHDYSVYIVSYTKVTLKPIRPEDQKIEVKKGKSSITRMPRARTERSVISKSKMYLCTVFPATECLWHCGWWCNSLEPRLELTKVVITIHLYKRKGMLFLQIALAERMNRTQIALGVTTKLPNCFFLHH